MTKKLSELLKEVLSKPIPVSTLTMKPTGERVVMTEVGIPSVIIKGDGMLHGVDAFNFQSNVDKLVKDNFSEIEAKIVHQLTHGTAAFTEFTKISVNWEEKKVYYREGMSGTEIRIEFNHWLDEINNTLLDTKEGPYERTEPEHGEVIVRSMGVSIGPFDAIDLIVYKVNDDWEFIEVQRH